MRSLRRCASNEFQAVAPRSGDFSNDIMSPSKKSLRASEQERADVARARRRWIRKQGLLDPARLVFIDETATSTSLVRLRGRCPRGERLVGSVPHGHWKTITLVVGLRHDGMVAPFVIDGPMNGTIFLAYVEQCLAPTLDHRDVVIMDNLPAHKVAGVTDAIEAVGATASATVFAGSQPDRAGFQQTQSAPPKGRRAHSSETLAQNSRAPANYKRRGMPQLFPPCRLRFNVSGIRSRYCMIMVRR